MPAVYRKQWLAAAARFPSLSKIEQERVTQRMHDWVKLSPEQRARARENYLEFSRLPPEQRENIKKKWEAYKSLPPDERQGVREQHKSAILLAPPPTPETSEEAPPSDAPVTDTAPSPELPPQ